MLEIQAVELLPDLEEKDAEDQHPDQNIERDAELDVLVGMLILGVFFFQIREQFDSLDLKHLEQLKDEE